MFIRFGFEFDISSDGDLPMLLALLPHPEGVQNIIGDNRLKFEPHIPSHEFLDNYGNRLTRIVAPDGPLKIWTDCFAEMPREADVLLPDARLQPVAELPDEVLTFLLPSRFVDSDRLADLAWKMFGDTDPGRERIQAICDYVHQRITFGYQFSRVDKTAGEAHLERAGVCRDFAHLAVSLCRTMNIPARYASGYLGDIDVEPDGPNDFCAWFEVFLDGTWYTLDARYNTPRIGRILMVRGHDAADVAMITSFGTHQLNHFSVWTWEMPDITTREQALAALEKRPEADAVIQHSSARIA